MTRRGEEREGEGRRGEETRGDERRDERREEQRKEKTYFGLAPSVVAPGGTSNGQPLVHAHQVSGGGAMREKKVHTRQNGEFQAV